MSGYGAAQQQPPQRAPHPARTVAAFARAVVERVLLNPLREGRLRVRGPRGYTAMVVLGCVGIVLALAAAVLGPWLRGRLTLVPTDVGIDMPSEAVGAVLALLVLAVALIQTAALHAPVWGRIAGLVVALVYLTGVALSGYRSDPGLALTVTAIAWVLLLGLQLLRWRRRSAWWELVVVLALYAVATGVVLSPAIRAGVLVGTGSQIETVWLLLLSTASFATPVVLVASLAIAQVGLRAAAWSVRGVRQLAPSWLALLLCVAVLGYRSVTDVLAWLDTWEGSATRVAGAAAFLAACALAWGAVAWFGRSRLRRPVGELTGDLTACALPLAALTSAGPLLQWLMLSPLGLLEVVAIDRGATELLSGVRDAQAAVEVVEAAIGSGVVGGVLVALMLVSAVLLAMRRWDGPAGFVAVLAVVHGTQVWTGLQVPLFYLPLALTGVAVLTLVSLLVSGRLSTRRLEAITLLGLLTTLLQLRDVIDEPLTLILGGAAGALIAMTWAFLTGGGPTAEAPGRRSRAAWFLGFTLLGFTAVAFATLAASPDATFNAQMVSQSGDLLFGTAIVMTAAVACLRSILRDRDLGQLT